MLVLHIDDEPILRALVADMLEMLGYEAASASGVAEGLRLAAERSPDLVIMDVNMPEVDGYEGCRRLRSAEAGRSIPILMLSAQGTAAEIQKAYEAGADDFIVKPVGLAAFKAKLEELLGGPPPSGPPA